MPYLGNPLEGHHVDFRFLDYQPELDSTNSTNLYNIPIVDSSKYNPKEDPDVLLGIKTSDIPSNSRSWWSWKFW